MYYVVCFFFAAILINRVRVGFILDASKQSIVDMISKKSKTLPFESIANVHIRPICTTRLYCRGSQGAGDVLAFFASQQVEALKFRMKYCHCWMPQDVNIYHAYNDQLHIFMYET